MVDSTAVKAPRVEMSYGMAGVEVDRERVMEHTLQFTRQDDEPLQLFLDMSRLPVTYGIPARVIRAIEGRIGRASLSICAIAEELKISKRTLQRRLNQKKLCFAELRDQVRFHFAVDYLLESKISIDAISSTLDFSDRTSFTNAFKRWSGLSPSVFRRIYRKAS